MSKDLYLEAYEEYAKTGSFSQAARNLGVDRKTVKKRVDRYYSDPKEAILQKTCLDTRTVVDDVSCYWVKTDNVSMLVRRKNDLSLNDVRDMIKETVENHAPKYEKIEYNEGSHLLVVDPADIHIGKLAVEGETSSNYNIEKAVSRVREGVNGVLEKSKPYGVKKILFVIGNDVLHTDNPRRTSTAGTPQDTDGQWWEMFLAAKKCYVAAIEKCTELAPVHIVFCPSNHDYASGWMLADTVYSWFKDNPNVSFGEEQKNISIAHRKYVVFGNNLIGFTHGDGAKESDLPNLMQYEAREAWGRTKFSYMYVHHLHHKIRKVYGSTNRKLEKDLSHVTMIDSGVFVEPENNVYVETIRSPSSPDGWHDRNGYVNRQAIEAFLHDPEMGQVARITHWF